MQFKYIVGFEYPCEHKNPVKAELVLHGDRVVTEDIKPYRTGKWVESEYKRGHYWCSACGGLHNDPETGEWREIFDYTYAYCPLCGAEMKGKKQ